GRSFHGEHGKPVDIAQLTFSMFASLETEAVAGRLACRGDEQQNEDRENAKQAKSVHSCSSRCVVSVEPCVVSVANVRHNSPLCHFDPSAVSLENNGPSSSIFIGSSEVGHGPMARCSFNSAGSKIIDCNVSHPWLASCRPSHRSFRPTVSRRPMASSASYRRT